MQGRRLPCGRLRASATRSVPRQRQEREISTLTVGWAEPDEGNRRHRRQKLDRSPGRGDEVTAAQLLRRRRAYRHSSASGRPALRQCSHHPRALGVQACALRVHEQYVPQPDGRGDCQAMVCGAVRVRGRGTTRRARLGHSLGRADRRGNAVSALSGLLPFSLALPGV